MVRSQSCQPGTLEERGAYPGFISNTSKKMTTGQPNEQTNHSYLLETGEEKRNKKSSLPHNEQQY